MTLISWKESNIEPKKLAPDITNLPYARRCKELDLQTLTDRRLRGDMIEVYKLLYGMENIDYRNFFNLSNRQSRGHSLKLERPAGWRTTLRGNYFSIRVISPWNSLPHSVVEAPSIAAFKSRYDRYIKSLPRL